MRLTLEVMSGPSSGKVINLEPNHVTWFGRTKRSEIPFPNDAYMSSVHFAIEVDAGGCYVCDSDSRNGTFVNGRRVSVAQLNHGDQIIAGRTAFAVRIEGDEPSELLAPAQTRKTGPTQAALDRLIALFSGELQPLFVLLDAARDPRILEVLAGSKEQYESLLERPEDCALGHYAPYLARMPEGSSLLETLVRQGWGNSWGVYLKSKRSLKEVRNHIRRFLKVRLTQGRETYFRYYDPRVLRLFLPTCTPHEITMFFGPVACFMMEAEDPDTLLQFMNHGHGAERVSLPLLPVLCDAITP